MATVISFSNTYCMNNNNMINNTINASSIKSSDLNSINQYFKFIEQNIVDNTKPQEEINQYFDMFFESIFFTDNLEHILNRADENTLSSILNILDHCSRYGTSIVSKISQFKNNTILPLRESFITGENFQITNRERYFVHFGEKHQKFFYAIFDNWLDSNKNIKTIYDYDQEEYLPLPETYTQNSTQQKIVNKVRTIFDSVFKAVYELEPNFDDGNKDLKKAIDYQIPNHKLTKLLAFKDSFNNPQLNNFVDLKKEIENSNNMQYKESLINKLFNMIFGEDRNLQCTINILFRNGDMENLNAIVDIFIKNKFVIKNKILNLAIKDKKINKDFVNYIDKLFQDNGSYIKNVKLELQELNNKFGRNKIAEIIRDYLEYIKAIHNNKHLLW